MEYFIYLTNDCNLHCAYCSVLIDCQKNDLPLTPTYSTGEYLSFIDRTQAENNDKDVNIYFFGGEPSLEYDIALKLVKEVTASFANKYNVHYILHTNGLLLDSIPSELSDMLSLIMLSINYEKIPKHHLSGSYFQTIIDNAITIKLNRNIPTIARLTITESTSLYTEIMQTSHYFDLIYWQIENCVAFNDYDSFYKTYTYELGLLFEIWLRYFKNGNMLKLIPFMAVVKFMFFHDRDDDTFSCGYGRGMVYIQTNGNCYACSDNIEEGKHYIGTLQTGVKLGDVRLSRLRCATCNYRSLCMGRCGRMHLEFENKHIREYCNLNQYMFNLFLLHKEELRCGMERNPHFKTELSDYLLEYTEFTP